MHRRKDVHGRMAASIPVDRNVIDARNHLDIFRNSLVVPAKGKVGESVIGNGRGIDRGVALELWVGGNREILVVFEIYSESVFVTIVDGLSSL